MKHYNNLKQFTNALTSNLKNGNEVDSEALVWKGEDGSYIVGDIHQLDDIEIEYVEQGTVAEYQENLFSDLFN